MTLSNIDVLDATTEATVEAAIDTLDNLTSIQTLTVTLADAGADAIFGWDDTAAAYENLTQAEVLAVIGSASLTAQGVVELATIAETNTGTDATRAVTPDGLDGWTGSAQVVTLGTITTGTWTGTTIAVANGGTGNTVGPAGKVLTATRDFQANSSTQSIAHGFGSTPNRVMIHAFVDISGGQTASSWGGYDGTTNASASAFWGISGGNFGDNVGATIAELFESSTVHQKAIATLDGTNVDLAWTETGATSAGTINMILTFT